MTRPWKTGGAALALLLALTLAYLGASALVEAYSDHACDDPQHCTVCRMLHWARQALEGTAAVAASAAAAVCLARAAREEVLSVRRRARGSTLVTLKVKLTD